MQALKSEQVEFKMTQNSLKNLLYQLVIMRTTLSVVVTD